MKTALSLVIILVHSCTIAQMDTSLTVYFKSASAELSELSSLEFSQEMESLQENYSILGVKVIGRTDDVGSTGYNERLSLNRGLALADLIQRNANSMSIETIGKGEVELKYSNTAKAIQRKMNRNAEAIFTIALKPLEIELVEIDELVEEEQPSYLEGDLKVGDKIVLEGILFVGNKDLILAESLDNTKTLLKELKANPNVSVQIQGHIYDPYYYNPNIPSPETEDLSGRRARKVYNYLIENGIEERRLSYIGFEGKYPLRGDPKNDRRVEIEITGLD